MHYWSCWSLNAVVTNLCSDESRFMIVAVSVGYGAEVGLNDGLQELWDPLEGRGYFVDHMQLATFWEDPRPLPVAKPVLTCAVSGSGLCGET